MRNFAAELEREKISQRTHEHLLNKARKGLVAGGLVFGYDNVRRPEGGTVRAINEEQADLVRELFERYAEGAGLRALAKRLNERGVPPPRAGKRGTGSWSSSAIRAMLRRDLYRGELIWNRFQKTYRGGTKVRVERPPEEWVHVDVPELRIIPEELWKRVQDRHRNNARLGRSPRGRKPKYLLTGLARCAECGGPMTASNRRQGRAPIKVYSCKWHRDRGNSVCTNTLGRPVAGMNKAVIDWIETNILTEELVVAVVDQVRAQLTARVNRLPAETDKLHERVGQLRSEMANLTAALATGVQSSTVIRAIADREQEVSRLEAELEVKQAAPKAIEMELHRMRREARRRIDDMQTIMERNPDEARSVLEGLLGGPILCEADQSARMYHMRAPLRIPEALGISVSFENVPSGI
ncbi:MAG: recombinase family protein [Sandaracinaceae bacterium]